MSDLKFQRSGLPCRAWPKAVARPEALTSRISGKAESHAMLTALLIVLSATGCAYHLCLYNTPSHHQLKVQANSPGIYVVRVADTQEYTVAPDGRVSFDVPALPRGCDTYLFDVIKIGDGSPENVRAIQLLKDGKVVRKFSLKQLAHLPCDSDGYRTVKVR